MFLVVLLYCTNTSLFKLNIFTTISPILFLMNSFFYCIWKRFGCVSMTVFNKWQQAPVDPREPEIGIKRVQKMEGWMVRQRAARLSSLWLPLTTWQRRQRSLNFWWMINAFTAVSKSPVLLLVTFVCVWGGYCGKLPDLAKIVVKLATQLHVCWRFSNLPVT